MSGLARRTLAEALGTGLLVTVVVGSGTAAQRLSPDDVGLQLLQNSTATVLGLFVLVTVLGPVSGAHLNPVVTLVDAVVGRRDGGGLGWGEVVVRVPAQVLGAVAGAVLSNLMFDVPVTALATTARTGPGVLLAEVVATAGLVLVVLAVVRTGRAHLAAPVGRRLRRRRVLVHLVHVVREPRRHRRPGVLRHLRRHRGRVGAGLRRRPAGRRRARRRGRPRPVPRAGPGAGRPGRPAQPRPWLPRPHPCPRGDPVSTSTPAETPAETPAGTSADRPSVMFVCVHNAGRSQMAAGWLRHLAGDRVEIRSAGTAPKDQVNPVAVEVMAEVGVDIAAATPTVLTTEDVRASDVVITMGCGDACPFVPGVRYLDWELDDPAGQGPETVRRIRDEIRGRVEGLVAELGVAAPA